MSDDKVVSILKSSPNLSGEAKCIYCRCQWQATAPVGTVSLECPACTLMTGRFIGLISYEGMHWECACENDLFKITPVGIYCPKCGAYQQGY